MMPEAGSVDVNLTKRGGHRPFWIGIGVSLGSMALVQGANYVATGGSRVTSPNYYILQHNLLGGMRSYGYMLMAVGATMLFFLTSDTRGRKRAVELFCSMSFFIAAMQFCALMFVASDTFNWAGPALWLTFAAIAGLMIVYPPPPRGSDDV